MLVRLDKNKINYVIQVMEKDGVFDKILKEKKRIERRNRLIKLVIFGVLFSIWLFLYLTSDIFWPGAHVKEFLVIVGIAVMFFLSIVAFFDSIFGQNKRIEASLFKKYVGNYMNLVLPGLKFYKNGKKYPFDLKRLLNFMGSYMRGWYYKYTLEDGIEFKNNGLYFLGNEIKVYSSKKYYTFYGIFVELSNNKKLVNSTVKIFEQYLVANDFFSKFLGGSIYNLKISGGKEIDTENIEFEKMFNVFAKDEIEVRKLLTPLFMNKLVQFVKLSPYSGWRFIFKDNKIFVVLDVGFNFLEIQGESKTEIKKSVFNFFYQILLLIDLVNRLNLEYYVE